EHRYTVCYTDPQSQCRDFNGFWEDAMQCCTNVKPPSDATWQIIYKECSLVSAWSNNCTKVNQGRWDINRHCCVIAESPTIGAGGGFAAPSPADDVPRCDSSKATGGM